MTSKTIYGDFTPTYLYIKQHTVTGMLYFGKTIKSNPVTYTGSGVYWKKHINKHGKEHVVTLWHELFTDKEEMVHFALNFSLSMNIVESDQWANLKCENGLDGGNDKGYGLGRVHTKETKDMLKEHFKTNHWSKLGIPHPLQGKFHSEQSKLRCSENKCKNVVTLISPNNDVYHFLSTRELIKFSNKHKLSFDCIKLYSNRGTVPDITTPNRLKYPKRINLTGWKIVTTPKNLHPS